MLEKNVAEMSNIAFLDGFTRTFRSQMTHLIKRILPSPALTGHLPIVACLLGYAMRRARFKVGKMPLYGQERIVLGQEISKSGIENAKPKSASWILLAAKNFDVDVRDKKGADNLAATTILDLKIPIK
ncbi:hypothetical protein Tco_1403444 [Tanacetum coccineum]